MCLNPMSGRARTEPHLCSQQLHPGQETIPPPRKTSVRLPPAMEVTNSDTEVRKRLRLLKTCRAPKPPEIVEMKPTDWCARYDRKSADRPRLLCK